jgi:hypothetical protein
MKCPKICHPIRVVVSLTLLSFIGVTQVAARESEILPLSFERDRQLQPWCPAPCEHLVPFTARYEKDDKTLVFVGVRHVFTPQNPTIRAVDSGFDSLEPAIVIIEGPPTAMGESPAPIVEQVRLRGSPEADVFATGEPAYAASLAIVREVPFIGGEPTRAELVEALQRKGFKPPEIAFSFLLGLLSQALRSGELSGTRDPKLPDAYAGWAEIYLDQAQMAALTFEDFTAQYESLFGVALTQDSDPVRRIEGEAQPRARDLFRQAEVISRDEHLLATIDEQLASKKRVLIVYGGSHWTTLSQALERRLGKPVVQPFLE